MTKYLRELAVWLREKHATKKAREVEAIVERIEALADSMAATGFARRAAELMGEGQVEVTRDGAEATEVARVVSGENPTPLYPDALTHLPARPCRHCGETINDHVGPSLMCPDAIVGTAFYEPEARP